MQGNIGVLALLIGIAALGVSGYVLMQDGSDNGDLTDRIAMLEHQVDDLETVLAQQDQSPEQLPSLMGHSLADPEPGGAFVESTGVRSGPPTGSRRPAGGLAPLDDESEATTEDIEALVDKAVAKKAEQLQIMRNKKPSIDAFASTLELTEAQRESVEREVVHAQNQIRDLLRTRTVDGTDLMDELVEVMSQGIANPGKNPGAGAKWFQRVMTEKIPGSDETYAMRAESFKKTLRQTFKREWSAPQYKRFEEWKMDPTEVQGIENSPWKEVEQLMRERVRELGGEFPDER